MVVRAERRRRRVFFNLFPLLSLIFAGIRCVRACAKSSAGCGDSMSGFYDLYAREEEEDIQEEGRERYLHAIRGGKFTNFEE